MLAAANSNVRERARKGASRIPEADFTWNGHFVALSASLGGIDALTGLFAAYPAKCPPTVVVLQAEPALVETFIAKLDRELACSVVAAKDGAVLRQGTIHIAYSPESHAVFEAGDSPRLRLIEREAVEDCRPSATLHFGTLARAGTPAVGGVLSGTGKDGARGLKLMREAGCTTMVQDPACATVGKAPREALAAGAAEMQLDLEALAGAIVEACNQC